jgi:hypothetical protein
MTLPAPKWFALIYSILFWVFILAVLFGSEGIAATAYWVLKLMFFSLAVFWGGAVLIDIILDIIRLVRK